MLHVFFPFCSCSNSVMSMLYEWVTSPSTMAQLKSLWLVCVHLNLKCCTEWKYTSCSTSLTTWFSLVHLPTTILKGMFFIMWTVNLYHNLWKWTCVSHRCESLNSVLRAFNVYGNRQAPSRDIGRAFATLFVLQTLASSSASEGWVLHGLGYQCNFSDLDVDKSIPSLSNREPLVGEGFQSVLREPVVEHYLLDTPMRECTTKDIYKHGALRKVSSSTTPLVNVMLVNIVCLRNYNLLL